LGTAVEISSTWGHCYDHYFGQFKKLFAENKILAIVLKTILKITFPALIDML
jgi:hypothetical protein